MIIKQLRKRRNHEVKQTPDYVAINKQKAKVNKALIVIKVIQNKFRRNLMKKMDWYTKLFNLERKEFMQIYAYYYALCFLTVLRNLEKNDN